MKSIMENLQILLAIILYLVLLLSFCNLGCSVIFWYFSGLTTRGLMFSIFKTPFWSPAIVSIMSLVVVWWEIWVIEICVGAESDSVSIILKAICNKQCIVATSDLTKQFLKDLFVYVFQNGHYYPALWKKSAVLVLRKLCVCAWCPTDFICQRKIP